MKKAVLVYLIPAIAMLGCSSRAEFDPSATNNDPNSPSRPAQRPIPPPTFVQEPTRLVALGDVHGDYAATLRALKIAGVIDDGLAWAGGNTVVVQTGDQLDRGDGERAILDLFHRLEDEAWAAGGAFYALLGNHETMNAQLDFRYVTSGGWVDFETIPFAINDPLMIQYASQQRGRVAAFRPGGPYAMLLSERNTTMVVGDTLFVHGGILPAHLAHGLEEINRDVQKFLRGEGALPTVMQGVDSPVWSRHYSYDTNAEDCILLDQVLEAIGAQRIVVGHSVQYEGITSECEGKAWRIDVGLSTYYGGEVSVLELLGDEVRILQ